jgi:hypothetical protein
MSDDPQSEIERTRLLEEQDRLMKAQRHLERVLLGSSVDGSDQQMDNAGPQEAVSRSSATQMANGIEVVKTESSPTPQKSGMFQGCTTVDATAITDTPNRANSGHWITQESGSAVQR